ncbi:ELL-associated factor 1-like [Uloborus diversus]|uniref:ELL-associated factor 1-like n=1 Tax=Uloborus diversus TaxID=327109 RepID=UPI00240A966B|nr:ELL-associated factor 1-like [Uloborus diversus]
MADKLGLANEIKEIKLGKSFMKGEHPCFHTFRYDFMPASLDTSKRATVDIGEGHQVTVTVPHIEGSGTANTVFKGSKKPYQKECVLIIDHTTGEITLEKLSYNVQLKKTRAEGSSKIRSNTPIECGSNGKKSPSYHKLSPSRSQKPPGRSSPVQKCSPLHRSPPNSHPSPGGSTSSASMPFLALTPPKQTTAIISPMDEEHVEPVPDVGLLSSSSSSESSSSGESSDSSSSDNEEMPATVPTNPPSQGNITNGLSSSPCHKKESTSTSSSALSMPSVNSLPSMPKFSQLSEDLKLSESDSDSDE